MDSMASLPSPSPQICCPWGFLDAVQSAPLHLGAVQSASLPSGDVQSALPLAGAVQSVPIRTGAVQSAPPLAGGVQAASSKFGAVPSISGVVQPVFHGASDLLNTAKALSQYATVSEISQAIRDPGIPKSAHAVSDLPLPPFAVYAPATMVTAPSISAINKTDGAAFSSSYDTGLAPPISISPSLVAPHPFSAGLGPNHSATAIAAPGFINAATSGTAYSQQLFHATAAIPKPSFASILQQQVVDVPMSHIPPPRMVGDMVTVQVDELSYRAKLEECKTNVIGRILLPKGSKPLMLSDLKVKLNSLWTPLGDWRLVPLGKGYFDIHFNLMEDMKRIWAGGTWSLSPGIFHLSQWVQDFNPNNQSRTLAQVWIRIFGLPQEYWSKQTLLAIARGAGIPLQIDKSTLNQVYGHYARVLVEMDLMDDHPAQIRVEREGFGFFVDIGYENLPAICSYCNNIGHLLSDCRHASKQNGRTAPTDHKKRTINMQYRPKVASSGAPEQSASPTHLENNTKSTSSSGGVASEARENNIPIVNNLVRDEDLSKSATRWGDLSDAEEGGTDEDFISSDNASEEGSLPLVLENNTNREDPGIAPCVIVPTDAHPAGDQVELALRDMGPSGSDPPFIPVLSKSQIRKLKHKEKVTTAPVGYPLRGRRNVPLVPQ